MREKNVEAAKGKREEKFVQGGGDIGKEGIRKAVEVKGMKLIKKSVMQYE